MAFHSVPRLDIEILSEAGALSFKKSSAIVAYSEDGSTNECSLEIRTAQRLGTGEPLDAHVWQLEERDNKCLPGVRFFQLTFKGNEYTQRLRKREKDAVNLYRSITSEDQIRLMIGVGKKSLHPLEVKLSYRLEKSETSC